MEILEPIALARLPRSPLGSPEVHFGPVYALRNGVKRKRHEICAAVDGASLNIYEAQTGRILLSHAVPPTATFSGLPYSLRWKEDDTTCRQTCYVSSDQGCQLHTVTSRGTKTDKGISTKLSASSSPVVELDISRNGQSTSTAVLQSDGTVSLASSGLSAIVTNRINLKDTPQVNILAANILDAESARKTVLKARPDLSSSLDGSARVIVAASGSLDSDTQKRSVHYAAWSFTPVISPFVKRIELVHLFEYNLSELLPTLANASTDILATSFGSRHTFVDFRTSQGLIRFDLQAATPRPMIVVEELATGLSSYVAISRAHIVAAFPGKLRILDVNYSTIQSTLDQRTKRKRNSQTHSSIRLVCYFSHINRALARDGVRLVAIDLAGTAASTMTSTLADNISRGVAARSQVAADLSVAEQTMGGSMQQMLLSPKVKHDLTTAIEKDDAKSFQAVLIERFLPNTAYSARRIPVSDEVVDFVLSSLFSVQAPSEDQLFSTRLRLNMVAPQLLHTLNVRGLLRPSKLKRSLKLGKDQSGAHLRCDDIAKALQNADHSLDLLAAYAENAIVPDVHEQTLLVRFLVQQVLLIGSEAQQPRLLGAESSEDMTIEALAADGHSQAPELLVLERCLIAILEQYSHFDISTISSSIRSTLSSDEIFGVVQLLRQQMFRGGHTGSVLTATKDMSAWYQDRVPLKSAVNILSACLDATGPLELIGGDQEDKLIERIIPDLLSEISLATQYIEESADLQGILRETLRYAEFQVPQERSKSASDSKDVKAGRVGEITTLYAQRTEGEDINGLPGALPLGLRADESLKATKVRRGGGQVKQRSERETLLMENRRKGPYTFERLVL